IGRWSCCSESSPPAFVAVGLDPGTRKASSTAAEVSYLPQRHGLRLARLALRERHGHVRQPLMGDQALGLGKNGPMAIALPHFLPVLALAGDQQRKHLDLH